MDLDQIKREVVEQIDILWQHKERGELNYAFVRDHALALLQLSDQTFAADAQITGKSPDA